MIISLLYRGKCPDILGGRFCPRIRGVQDQRIYRIDSDGNYGALASLVSRADRTIDTQVITEQWDRMGQFYASLASGHTTASVALRRLAAYSAKTGIPQIKEIPPTI